MIADPLLKLGSKLIIADALPLVILVIVGANGGPAGTTDLESDSAPSPTAFIAFIVMV